MDTVSIRFSSHDGAPGVDSAPDNPLARALNRLLESGQPFERLSACFFDPSPMTASLRWFGLFVYSVGERVIYFPGLTEVYRQTRTARGPGATQQHEFRADHLSLEADRQEWHLTSTGSEGHIGSFRTTDLGEGRVLWFGMSIASPNVLRPVNLHTEVAAHIPPTDARRRIEVVMQAREAVVFNTLLFNEKRRDFVTPCFAHFSVIVGPCGFIPYTGELLGLPFRSPFVSPPLGTLTNVPLRSHRVSLEPHVDLDIMTAVLPGAVSQPVSFTSP